MAGEIKVVTKLTVEKSGGKFEFGTTSPVSYDQTGTNVTSGVQAIGTSAENIGTLTDIGTVGWAYFKNLDGTNYVEIGVDNTGFVPVLRLNAGESITCRVVGTPQARADTASCDLQYAIFEA